MVGGGGIVGFFEEFCVLEYRECFDIRVAGFAGLVGGGYRGLRLGGEEVARVGSRRGSVARFLFA